MDVLARLLAVEGQATPGPTDDFWYRPASGVMSATGMRVGPDQAETVSAFYRGVQLVSNSVAKLPLIMYRRLDDGGKERAPAHPLYQVLHSQPNTWQTSFEWRRLLMRDIILRGNGYSRIIEGPRGFADQLRRIHPDLVTPEQLESGRIVYHIKHPKTHQTTTATQDDIFHLRGVSDDGVTGKSVITWARDSIGLAMATEGYAARLFGQGAMHGGVIKMPPGMPLTPEASDRMARSFQAATSGPQNWHRPVILELGAEWKETTMTGEDSQYLLSRKFSVTEMARWLGVPPHKIYDLDRSTNNNIEHQALEWVSDDLSNWLVMWEQAIARDLILATDRYFAEHNVDALLRGDSAARGEFYSKMFNIGAVSQNEVRIRENMNRLQDGDTYYVQGAMRPTDEPYQPAAAAAPGPPATKKPAPPARPDPEDDDEGDDRARAIVTESAARVQRKEVFAARRAAVKFAADAEAFEAWATAFYADHQALVEQTLRLSLADAQLYCDSQRDELVAGGIAVTEAWTSDYLVGVALDAPRPNPMHALLRSAIDRPLPPVQVNAGVEKGAVHVDVKPAPVTVTISPVHVDVQPPSVTIAAGAIQHTTHVEAADPVAMDVTKKVTRSKDGIEEVHEAHRPVARKRKE
jgi:HK97 family phage portal protein